MPSHRDSAIAALKDSGYDDQLVGQQSGRIQGERAESPKPSPSPTVAKENRVRRGIRRMGHDFARAKNFIRHKLTR